MSGRRRTFFAAPGRLGAVFLLVSGIPMVAVGWLGWRFVEQDRLFDAQRIEEQLESAANLLIRELERGFNDWEDSLDAALSGEPSKIPPGGLLLVFDQSGVRSRAGVGLPYYPAVTASAKPPYETFQAAEVLEFRSEDLIGAEALYGKLAAEPDALVRAGALMRLARTLRREGRPDEALDAYDKLSQLSNTPVAGATAELVALRERIALLAMNDQLDASADEAALLSHILAEGRYLIDRATFDFYSESAFPPIAKAGGAFEMAEAVSEIWSRMQTQGSGRISYSVNGRPFAGAWRRTDEGSAMILGTLDSLASPLNAMLDNLDARMALEDPASRTLWGQIPEHTVSVLRTPRETGLPWTLRVAPYTSTITVQAMDRRNLVVAGIVAVLLAIGGAGYAAFRALRRELNVAQVQSDFVAAVSHEFRTPLTAMRHLTDILEEERADPDRLTHYYRALGKETRRLHTMVENLLDFARLESGRRTYVLNVIDAQEFVISVVDEFRNHSPAAATMLRLETTSELDRAAIPIHADRDALALALRNVIDNAIKYSPESTPVTVSIERTGDFVGIRVRDQGPGIPKAEQAEVFAKFMRGSASRSRNVKGTGIGLPIAQQIVAAHQGRIELESEPGRGSCFTIWMPSAKGQERP